MRHFFNILLFTVIVSAFMYAQKDTVYVPDTYDLGGAEGTLNDSVTAHAANLSNTVFKLKPYGLYILTGAITTSAGQVLEIVADDPGTTQATAPPMIAWTPSSATTKTYSFDIGGELIMKNIWLLYGSTDGTRTGSSIRIGDSASVSGGRCSFDNVIFDFEPIANSAGCVIPYATHFVGRFHNCYFKNCGDTHFRYYGRAVSFGYQTTGLHIDSLSFENCTFANMGYVYMQEGAEYGDNIYFNHCTFLNVVMFSLESGWWYKLNVTNSLFVDTFMFGAIPANDGEGFGGTINIAPIDSNALGSGFGFSVPFTEQDRRILFTNNNYYIEPWLVDWMANNPFSKNLHKNRQDDLIPVPMPAINGRTRAFFDTTDAQGNKLFPYMNLGQLDSLDARFVLEPTNYDSLKLFLQYKWDNNADVEWSWKPENDYKNQLWPMEENLSYANDTLKTAAMGGFPSGDLFRWWPTQYKAWAAQQSVEHNRIYTWLNTGKDVTGVKEIKGNIPDKYTLSQNYPNPFNPTTNIEYSIPKSGLVSLKVYNILGQEVANLFQGFQKAGSYKVDFNASKLASGVYLYKMEAGNISLTKKLILMK